MTALTPWTRATIAAIGTTAAGLRCEGWAPSSAALAERLNGAGARRSDGTRFTAGSVSLFVARLPPGALPVRLLGEIRAANRIVNPKGRGPANPDCGGDRGVARPPARPWPDHVSFVDVAAAALAAERCGRGLRVGTPSRPPTGGGSTAAWCAEVA